MKRRWFAVMGAGIAVGLAALAVAVGPPRVLSPTLVVLAAAALLFVLGGLDAVPSLVPWYRLVGVAEVLVGVLVAWFWIAPTVGDWTAANLVRALVGVVTALLFGFVGVDWYLGGRHYDLARFEPGPIFGGGEDAERG